MNGFRRDQTDSRSLVVNQGVAEDHVNDDYYKEYLPAGRFLPFAPASGTSERFDYWVFPDAQSTQRINSSIDVKRLWINGNLEATYFFTGDAASTNPIRWNWVASARAIGESIGAGEINVSADVAGPAAANLLQSYTFTTYLTINSDDVLVGMRVLREGAHANDTYAGNAHFIGCLLRFIPASQSQDATGRVA